MLRSLEDLDVPGQKRVACRSREVIWPGWRPHLPLCSIGVTVDHWPLGWWLGVHKAVLFALDAFHPSACPLQDMVTPLNPSKASHPLCTCPYSLCGTATKVATRDPQP